MSASASNSEKLEEMLRPHREASDVLKKALEEVSKEDAEKKISSAKELIRKAQELQGRMEQAERTFKSEKSKFDKELGKILSRLRNMATGKPLDEGVDDSPEVAAESAQ